MLKDITLGQFFPGDTLAHKLDPRTKLLVTVLYVVALFTAKSYIAYGLLILTLIVAVRISRVGAKALFKGLKPVLFIIAFTALLNLFYTPGTELCHFWIFRITIEGVRAAITMMLRITLLIMGTFLLTYTTSPIRLTDGLGVDAAIDITGAQAAINADLKCLRAAGRMVCVGLPSGPVTLQDMTDDLIYCEVTLTGVSGRLIWDTWQDFARVMSGPYYKLDKIIGGRYTLEQYEDALAAIRQGVPGKMLLNPNASDM